MSDNDDKLEKLKKESWYGEKPYFNTGAREDFSVSIRPDKKISLGNFKPDPLIPGGYLAHPTTIRAMKKDIFVAGENVNELMEPYTCESCKMDLDRQFWHFCPYCESSFSS